jgi:hypothetical protein
VSPPSSALCFPFALLWPSDTYIARLFRTFALGFVAPGTETRVFRFTPPISPPFAPRKPAFSSTRSDTPLMRSRNCIGSFLLKRLKSGGLRTSGSEWRLNRAREFVLTKGRGLVTSDGCEDVEVDASGLYHEVSWLSLLRRASEYKRVSSYDMRLPRTYQESPTSGCSMQRKRTTVNFAT